MGELHPNSNTDLLEKEDIKVQRPRKFQVILFNDNYTSMEFVVQVLVEIFHKSLAESTQKMIEVHQKGKSLVGIYTREIAESKVLRVREMARKNNFPLKATMEEMS